MLLQLVELFKDFITERFLQGFFLQQKTKTRRRKPRNVFESSLSASVIRLR